MAGAARHELLTDDEYLRVSESVDGLVEYHDGRPFRIEMPSIEHNRIVGQLVELLRGGLAGRPCTALPPGQKVRVAATNHSWCPM